MSRENKSNYSYSSEYKKIKSETLISDDKTKKQLHKEADIHIRSIKLPTLPTQPRLDKVTITNIDVVSISDIRSLISKGIIEQHKGTKRYIQLPDGTQYSKLQIKNTSLFDKFTQVISNRGSVLTYLELSIDVPIIHNLIGYTIGEYQERILQVQSYLLQSYGIGIDISRASFKYLEIGKTIRLDQDYSKYWRSTAVLINGIPKGRRLNSLDVKPADEPQSGKKYIKTFTCSSGKRGLELIIYDKGSELDTKNYPGEKTAPSNLYRMELKLQSKTSIKRNLGTYSVWGLRDSDIARYFYGFIDENFKKSYFNNADMRIKNLVKMILKSKAKNYHWIKSMLIEAANYELDTCVPLMLDIKEFLQALDAIGYANPKEKYYKHNSALNTCHKFLPHFDQGDDVKCQNLITWLLAA